MCRVNEKEIMVELVFCFYLVGPGIKYKLSALATSASTHKAILLVPTLFFSK